MRAEAKDDPSRVNPQRGAAALPTQPGLRLLHALTLVILGGWLVVRALQTLWPNARLSLAIGFAGTADVGWAVAALLLGVLLLIAATTLPMGQAWAWAVAALCALAALILIIAAWAKSGSSDWPGALLALVAVVLLAAPSARALYLNAREHV